jgi:hypothetical protein
MKMTRSDFHTIDSLLKKSRCPCPSCKVGHRICWFELNHSQPGFTWVFVENKQYLKVPITQYMERIIKKYAQY